MQCYTVALQYSEFSPHKVIMIRITKLSCFFYIYIYISICLILAQCILHL